MNEIADTPSPSEFGEAEITELVAVFYRRVREDEMTGPMYPWLAQARTSWNW